MIAVDTSILVYSHRDDSPFHSAAFACVGRGPASWAISRPCLHEFLAITTHPRNFAPPTRPARAIEQVDAWKVSLALVLLTEVETHWPTLRSMPSTGRIAGLLVHDAHIAALRRDHGVRELWSADRDFSRFAGATLVNLLGSRSTS